MEGRASIVALVPFVLVAASAPPAPRGPAVGDPVQPPLFTPAAGSPMYVGPMAGRPAVGDMNGDGKPDVVVACGTCCGSRAQDESGHVVVLLNDGAGRLSKATGPRVLVGPSVRKVALGDVNGDGKLDAVAAEHDTYGVTVLLGDGRGGLSPANGSPFMAARGSRPHTHEIALADVNSDTFLDALTTNANDNTISVLLGDGKAGFAPAPGSPFPTGRHPYDALAVRDLNGDGAADIAVPLLAGGKVGVLFGDGKGAFSHAPDSRYPVAERPGYVAAGDVNGDGRPDILATHDDVGLVDVLLGESGGRFVPAPGSPVRLTAAVWGIAIGDLNGDGFADVALGGMAGRGVVILLGDGRGGFTEAPARPEAGDQPNYIAIADLNGDRRPDIVTGNYGSGDVTVLLNAPR